MANDVTLFYDCGCTITVNKDEELHKDKVMLCGKHMMQLAKGRFVNERI